MIQSVASKLNKIGIIITESYTKMMASKINIVEVLQAGNLKPESASNTKQDSCMAILYGGQNTDLYPGSFGSASMLRTFLQTTGRIDEQRLASSEAPTDSKVKIFRTVFDLCFSPLPDFRLNGPFL